MAERPIEMTVENVASSEGWTGRDGPMTSYEVLFAGEGRTWKVHLPTAEEGPTSGAVLRGWKNADKGTFGIAKDRPYNPAQRGNGATSSTGQSSGRTDATGISIERQKSADIAKDLAIATAESDPVKLEANFEHYFDVVYAKVADLPADAS